MESIGAPSMGLGLGLGFVPPIKIVNAMTKLVQTVILNGR